LSREKKEKGEIEICFYSIMREKRGRRGLDEDRKYLSLFLWGKKKERFHKSFRLLQEKKKEKEKVTC